MQTSYILKTNKTLSKEDAVKILNKLIEEYEKSLIENIAIVLQSDIELYKLEKGIYIKVI